MDNYFDKVTDPDNLLKGFDKSKQGVDWKGSVQFYYYDLLSNLLNLSEKLKNNKYEQKKFQEFILSERGKRRYIKAVSIGDRVVQRTLCDQVLVPILSKYLIYDNGASIKSKGLDFSRKRLEKHLHNFWIENQSNDGYILLIDFSKYFDNIRHDILNTLVSNKIDDENIMILFKKIVKTFEIDVSYLNEEEYKNCINSVFNTLKYTYKSKDKPTKTMNKSLGIGSQVSQISGVFYPSKIDNYCKIVKGLKYYGRYMDDSYIIHNDKNYLKEIKHEIKDICNELGIFMNDDKTQIIKLSRGFKWLQITYKLKNNGRIIKLVNEKTIIRERRKLKKQYKKYLKGEIDIGKIYNMYRSWRGEYIKYDSKSAIYALDELFDLLFGYDSIKYLKEKEISDKKRYNFKEMTDMIYTN